MKLHTTLTLSIWFLLSLFSSLALAQNGTENDTQTIEEALLKHIACLRKDKTNKFCREFYNELKRQYECPFCLGVDIKGTLSISDGSNIIGIKNIAKLTLDRDPDTQFGTLWLKLDSQGTELLRKMTSARLGKPMQLKVMNHVLNPMVQSVIKNGQLSILLSNQPPSASEAFAQLCSKPVHPKLKPELQLE